MLPTIRRWMVSTCQRAPVCTGRGRPRSMTVATMLALPAFAGAEVIAGRSGLDRVVRRANVMEVPDIVPWVRDEGLLLTTGYPLREATGGLAALVAALDERGVSALAVKLHRYLERLPEPMLAEADRRGLPVVLVPDEVGFDEVLTELYTSVVSERASLLERSEEVQQQLVDIVLTGGGVDDVTASVSTLFGGLAMVTTADGRVISDVGAPEQRPRCGSPRSSTPAAASARRWRRPGCTWSTTCPGRTRWSTSRPAASTTAGSSSSTPAG